MLLLRGGLVLRDDRFAPSDVLVDGDRIEAVGPDLPVPARAEVWELTGDLVIPGLVDAHYHSPDNLVTGRIPAAPLELWSLASVPSRVSAPEQLRLAALLGAAQLLRGGVTSVIDVVRPGQGLGVEGIDAVADAYLESGIRAAIAPVVTDLHVEATLPLAEVSPPAVDEKLADEQLAVLEDLFCRWHGREGRLAVHVAPSAPHRCSDRLLEGTIALARRLQTQLHTHALESPAQAEQARRRWGRSMLAHLDRLGALSPGTVLAHLVWPERDELDLVAERGAVVAHNPASNCALGSGLAPVPGLLAAGATLALGTDAATCNDGLSMFEAMKLATILHRPGEPDWTRWPTAGASLGMATRGGAAALGLADHVGCIAPGYLADLAVVDVRSAAFVPPNDLVQQLVMRAGADVVRHVFVAGTPVVRDRALLTLDWERLAAESAAWASMVRRGGEPDEPLRSSIEALLRALRGVKAARVHDGPSGSQGMRSSRYGRHRDDQHG